MKGDFTRSTFRKRKHYRKVNMQQGRVQVDADWNEQVDIDFHYEKSSLKDLIGASGTPIDNVSGYSDGFKIESKSAKEYMIKRGHYYVDGILCENEQDVAASLQEDLPTFEGTSLAVPSKGTYIVYLDVWERHITALDDPLIRDVALIGADTATRSKIIWQVKLLPIGDKETKANCLSELDQWQDLVARSSGKLSAWAHPTQPTSTPCVLPPEAGYRRLQNQLYRVEVHDQGEVAKGNQNCPTFKWSRDNGSVVSKILGIDGQKGELEVNSTGRDSNFGFAKKLWVEVTDDRHELLNLPGAFVRLTNVDQNMLFFNPNDPNNVKGEKVTNDTFPQELNPKVRRWDNPEGPSNIVIPSTNYGYIPLEDGVEVKFEPGSYATGDFWLIRASTTTADIEWPETHYLIQWDQITVSADEGKKLKAFLADRFGIDWVQQQQVLFAVDPNDNSITATDQTNSLFIKLNDYKTRATLIINGNVEYVFPVVQQNDVIVLIGTAPKPLHRKGVKHHFARLALLTCTGNGLQVIDCRNLFAVATDLTHLYYVGGDGQEASPRGGLAAPLMAGVSLGKKPLRDCVVRFTKKDGNGKLVDLNDNSNSTGTLPYIDVTTDSTGIAGCKWTLDPAIKKQRVEAFLIDPAGNQVSYPSLYYSATLPTNFYYVSGDGKEIAPGGSTIVAAGLAVGSTPAKGHVRFTITSGSGSLNGSRGNPVSGVHSSLDVATDSEGIAQCKWTIDSTAQVQQVQANLLDGSLKSNLQPICFNAVIASKAEAANTGIIELLVPVSSTKKFALFGPFHHGLKTDIPPAIILGIVGTRGKGQAPNEGHVYAMEDTGLYNTAATLDIVLPLFKPVLTNTKDFMVFVELSGSSWTQARNIFENRGGAEAVDGILHMMLRWWAIPAQDQAIQKGGYIKLTPESGTIGTRVKVEGGGFAPLGSLTLTCDLTSNIDLGRPIKTGNNGLFTGVFIVPSSWKVGSHIIGAHDDFTSASSPFQVTPTLRVAKGVAENTTVLTGSGFPPSTRMTLVSGSDTPVEVTTDETGAFTKTLQIPAAAKGTYSIELKDSAGKALASRRFRVIKTSPPG